MANLPGFTPYYNRHVSNFQQQHHEIDSSIIPQAIDICTPFCISANDEACAEIPGIGRKCIGVNVPGKYKVCYKEWLGTCDGPFGTHYPCMKNKGYVELC